jgi:ribose transport system substrate-binding protein
VGALKLKAVLVSAALSTAVLSAMPANANGLKCETGETYIMNVMVSGHPYWVPVYQGFKQAAEAFGCETIFSGTPDYDITKQIASFEQDMVKQPAGILVHPMQSDPFIEPINRAIESGTQIVTFAADSPKSNRTAYITSDNLAEAKFAAEEIVKQVGDSAEYAVLENPGQSNHDLRVTALISYMEDNYPNMKLVGRQATNQDSNAAYRATASILEAEAMVLIMHADVTPTTLEHIKAGNIHMALNPNQGMQGFVGFMATFLAAHADVFDPFNDYKVSGYNPVQIPYVDNGFAVITKDNADSFDLNTYMEGRDPS